MRRFRIAGALLLTLLLVGCNPVADTMDTIDTAATARPSEDVITAIPAASVAMLSDAVHTLAPEDTGYAWDGDKPVVPSVLPSAVSQSPVPLPTTLAPTPTPTPTPKPGRLAGLIIGVDAGHQRKGDSTPEPIAPGSAETKARVTSGTQGRESGVYEYVVNLQMALKLQKLLEAEGAVVVMSRTTHDVNISNSERATMMNEAGCDLVIRIHCNGADDRSVHGALMMYPATGDHVDTSYLASKLILEEVLARTGARDMGIQKHSDMTGFNWSTVPSTLIEMGYMTNKDEDLKLVDDQYQDKLAQGMLEGIVRYFKER